VLPHPTRYADLPSDLSCEDLPQLYSYHIHFLFWQYNTDSVNAAFKLQAQFMEHFQLTLKDNTCNESTVWNTTHPVSLCMFPANYPFAHSGPFLVSEWAVFVPVETFFETVTWSMQHRGNLDIIVHPNSGCEIEDHRDWSVWGGNKWELDLTTLHFDCPGCDDGSCPKMGSNLMFQGEANKCGLTNGKNPGDPFVLMNLTQFCTSDCQNWVNQLEMVPGYCPGMCDYHYPNEPQHSICVTHIASLVEMIKWQQSC
jgi:DOPA 4,5-dioxygenase